MVSSDPVRLVGRGGLVGPVKGLPGREVAVEGGAVGPPMLAGDCVVLIG